MIVIAPITKNTKMPAILVECGFVDCVEDMERFNAENIASAIVVGLTGYFVNEQLLVLD